MFFLKTKVSNSHHLQNEFIERGCRDQLVGILIGRSGYITSRNFAHNDFLNSTYPSNEHCQWLIKASPESRIRLRFTHFNLEPGKHCVYDNLTIWLIETPQPGQTLIDLDSHLATVSNKPHMPRKTLIGSFCGDQLPPLIETPAASSLLIVFQSDATNSLSGFRVVWEAFVKDDPLELACTNQEPATLTGSEGLIQLNHFDGRSPYRANSKCGKI